MKHLQNRTQVYTQESIDDVLAISAPQQKRNAKAQENKNENDNFISPDALVFTGVAIITAVIVLLINR